MTSLHKNPVFYVAAFLACAAIAVIYGWWPLPVYPDEVTYRIFVSRGFIDGWNRMAFDPYCESSALYPIPVIFYPAALLYSLLNLLNDYWLLRVAALSFFAATLGVMALALRRYITPENARRLIPAILFSAAAMFVGFVPPSSFMMLRAEYMALLALVLSLWALHAKETGLRYGILALLLLSYSMALYMHPRVAFFMPALAAVIVIVARLRVLPSAFGLLFLLLITVPGVQSLSWQWLHCPESPKEEERLHNATINPAMAFTAPAEFMREAIKANATRDWKALATSFTFSKPVDLNYLPVVDPASPGIKPINRLINASRILNYLVALVFLVLNLVSAGRAARQGWRHLFAVEGGAMPLTLALLQLGVLVQILLNNEPTFYNQGFWSVAFALLNMASLVVPRRLASWVPLVLFVHVAAMLAGLVVLYGGFHYRAHLGDPLHVGIPLRDYNYTAMKKEVEAAMKPCNLTPDLPRLVYDDGTYPFLQPSPYAIPITWVGQAAGSQSRARDWIAKRASGLVTFCSNAHGFETRGHPVKQTGRFCCIDYRE